MDAGGWVGATLGVDSGRSVIGRGCSIVLFGRERWRPAAEAGGAETEYSSRFISGVGGVSPRYHTLEASLLRARDSPTIGLSRVSPGQIRGV